MNFIINYLENCYWEMIDIIMELVKTKHQPKTTPSKPAFFPSPLAKKNNKYKTEHANDFFRSLFEKQLESEPSLLLAQQPAILVKLKFQCSSLFF